MPKLHELLAVQGNLEGQANKTRADLTSTFEKKRHLFEEKRKTFTSNLENAVAVVEEQQDIQTTVAKEIEWMSDILAKTYDVGHQIDVANTMAKADVVTEDGDTLLKDVPATSLLQLEKRLKEVHDLVAAVPTLDPAKGFNADEARGKGIYRARDVKKARTKKMQKPLVMYPATKEHPAQTQLVTEDTETGQILEQEWSALLTPALKSDILNRCDVLIRAVKKARAKANELDLSVNGHKIGKTLLDFVLKPLSS